jgi:membrane fusion protein, macrolide-specific efflux system
MTVAFSESDIGKVKVGQPANVTLDALSGVELAAHVTSISTLGTTSSSVVSYDATLTLNQHDSRVKPGMSASAAVITGQASGVNLPNSAVTGTGSASRVNVMRNGKQVSTPIVVGLVGDSRTQIVSGLSAGQQVVVTTTLPSLSSSSAGSSSSGGTLGGATGAGGFGGAGGLGGGAARRLLGGGGGGFTGGG